MNLQQKKMKNRRKQMKKIELLVRGQDVNSLFSKVNELIMIINELIDKQEVKINEKPERNKNNKR